ncbi:class IV lanthionine synthetase LanL [Streptomyces chartreusis]|uniref:class IV lanthionine synthetase LanL n=1 Tax=Streptomyces chartreusis TaxID=1969 RepID=UPI00369D00F1
MGRQWLSGWEADSWTVVSGDFWTRVTPEGHRHRRQGWKLHVSATVLSAPFVLRAAMAVLVRHRCAFKFAGSVDRVEQLVSGTVDRGSGGKFLTAYPDDDQHLVRVADDLHEVTRGFPGPGILSDRPYRPGSLVHYRYGCFLGTTVLSNDGCYETMLQAPDGQLVEDKRLPYFSPPAWAVDTFQHEAPKTAAQRPKEILLGGRFAVRAAIKHAFKGGVYRAVDQVTGEQVIIKQGRRWAGANASGTDVRDFLQNEAKMLQRLAGSLITPRLVEVFDQQGDIFLVQELVDGQRFREWVEERLEVHNDSFSMPTTTAIDMAKQLVALVEHVHNEHLVLRDFNPNNIMVTPDDELRLIDLEMVADAGSTVTRAMTLGYAAPEQVTSPRRGDTANPEVDLYSLGATLLYLVSGVDPLLCADEPRQPMGPRVQELLTYIATRNEAAHILLPLIHGLLHESPQDRWTLAQATDFLATHCAVSSSRHISPLSESAQLSTANQQYLIDEGLAYLIETMEADSKQRLWRSGEFGSKADACAVQHGAAGVLAVLTRAAQHTAASDLLQAVDTVAHWIRRRLGDEPRVLPGLYFGRSGTAWALFDAARLLNDQRLEDTALWLADQVPTSWPNPDICHGASGAGMAMLHLWRRTEDETYLKRALACAEAVADAALESEQGVLWQIPPSFSSALAGLTHYGFAHGVAGIGNFLLATGQATGESRFIELATAGAQTLSSVAQVEDGAAFWPTGEEPQPIRTRMAHWCSGSSGVGTFLLRLWCATGDEHHRVLAEQAAVAVRRMRWFASPAACHGLAGDGEFLLDMASTFGSDYRQWAAELAQCLHARRTKRASREVVPDETHLDVVADYQTGLSGALGLLLRLHYGGPRLWMPDAPSALRPHDLRTDENTSGATER